MRATPPNVHAGEQFSAQEFAASSIEEAIEHLATSRQGLSEREAAARLLRFGANRLPRAGCKAWFLSFAENFIHLLALLLWGAAGLAWFVGMPELALAIGLVIVVNGVFSYWQQYRAEQAVEALQALLPRRVIVRREGLERTILADEVAVGDVLILREGAAIAADARLVEAQRLRLDVSSLTGESRSVSRDAGRATTDGRTTTEFANIVLAGTLVASGRGEALVFATGSHTEFGRLAALTHGQPDQPSPLKVEIRRITRTITLLAMGMGAIFFAVGAGLGRLSVVEGFLFALGMIVANVPEGLLPTISLALALGVRRMAARKAIVKRLERVEALGAVTVIVTDKTGTLTKNQMTVRRVWCGGQQYEITGLGYEPIGQIISHGSGNNRKELELTLRTAALCCDARLILPVAKGQPWQQVGDPTEAALVVAARKAGIDEASLAECPRLAELPFDSIRKRMTTIQQTFGGPVACVKGALNEVLPRSSQVARRGTIEPLCDALRQEIETAGQQLASLGLRVLAVAQRPLGAWDTAEANGAASDGAVEQQLTFLGLAAMEDPPREEVPAALSACAAAGIRVIMATGDDGKTAEAIGREIGLIGDGTRIVNGSQIEAMPDRELAVLLAHPNVLFSRVSPAHKLRIVETLQRRGEVVALTGDGVNDAPALKRADIGVAMGASGTDVAREAADMILLDDNFATIVAAVEEGRAVYDNVRKFVTYIFASNVPEIVPFAAFALFRIPLPLTVMQILAVDLGTDLLPALALGVERPEPNLMRRPPRRRGQRLLDRSTLLRAYCWLGAIEAVLGLAGFFFVYWWAGWRPGERLAAQGPLYIMATTMSLAAIVGCQAGNAFACRSQRQSIFSLGLFSNRSLAAAVAAEITLLLLLIYVPLLARLFHLEPLKPVHWLLVGSFGPLLLMAEEARKSVARKLSKSAAESIAADR